MNIFLDIVQFHFILWAQNLTGIYFILIKQVRNLEATGTSVTRFMSRW